MFIQAVFMYVVTFLDKARGYYNLEALLEWNVLVVSLSTYKIHPSKIHRPDYSPNLCMVMSIFQGSPIDRLVLLLSSYECFHFLLFLF